MKRLLTALVTVMLALVAVDGVRAQTSVAVDIDRATLQWDWLQGTGGVVETFRMKCGSATGAYSIITVISDPAARSVPVRNVISGVGTYFCAVSAANQFGESANSNEVTFTAGTVPGAPTGLRIIAQ
jgi:hypothetical protein